MIIIFVIHIFHCFTLGHGFNNDDDDDDDFNNNNGDDDDDDDDGF